MKAYRNFDSNDPRKVKVLTELPWKLICPGCGRMDGTPTRVLARYNFQCPTDGCERRLSDYVREAV